MSFGTGLSGLNAASKNLDVIGHNIANANTTGMKAGRAEFAEMYAASLGAAGGSNGGIGVSVAAVAQMFTQGNIKITGNNLDMAINGEGFFKVTLTDGSTAYTRNGEFKLDRDGYIVTNNGARLQGFPTDTKGAPTSVVSTDLQLPTGGIIAPRATGTNPAMTSDEGVFITANLDANAPGQNAGVPTSPIASTLKTYGTALNVYDEQGVAIPVQIYFVKDSSTPQTWHVVVEMTPAAGGPAIGLGSGTITFGTDGLPTAPPAINFTIAAGSFATGIPSAALTNIPIKMGDGSAAYPYTLTQYGAKFSVYDLRQDGYAAGELTSINVEENGVITARYSNGVSQANGMVMLTRFRNVQGLQPINGGYWQKTQASGDPIEGQPTTGRFGLIRSGALEESNVDLTQELVNMIVAQRHYQANAQTIKTQDQVQQTLVNLR
ncbi:flagellar hook protein FlgE [Tepidimonas charontis]|uniref:Flagellar hook protein FlgE n=1 Tax=Tepidimonas charontis TaxID=2267262 RepID=A0A554XG31_9BURK|nr:flagellar hook protein FlgE [Tepidimonas charontis]TSE34793.1 Flagellar hook protein FlgE [Tepidimonas charontis]